MKQSKILIVEDEVFIAEDLKDSLESFGYKVCDICHDGQSALKAIHRFRPDLILLDINIKGSQDGIQLASFINDQFAIPFIYLTSYASQEYLSRAKNTRPRGYLLKPFRERDVMTAIEVSLFNHQEDVKKKSLQKCVVDEASVSPFSEKEYEIFIDLAEGLNNRQIGEKRYLSVNTIKTYVKRIFEKLEVNDRVSALRKVIIQQN